MAAITPIFSLQYVTDSVSRASIPNHIPRFQPCPNGSLGRRIITLSFLTSSIWGKNLPAKAFEFGLVAPDQTFEQALSVVREHAHGLLDIKEYIESESWKDAQQELRRNSGYLKQDFYTIIQNKPGKERPELRKMYSDLFNNVSRLDYAARDMDKVRVMELYHKIVKSLNSFLSRV